MNEKDLERRLRSVTEGRRPNAPQSLRHFLHDLPETQAARESALRRLWRSYLRPAHTPRLAFGGAALAVAVVVGLVGADVLLTVRTNHYGAAPTATIVPTNYPTVAAGGFMWTGNPDSGAIMPKVAVAAGSGGYLGVGASAAGTGVLLSSTDALHWTVKETSAIDPKTVDLKWIAHGDNGFVAVGATIAGAASGSTAADPRFFYSPDGNTWSEGAIDPSLGGAPALTVVAGPGGFLAAGWNGAGAPDSALNGTYLWTSTDGRTWIGGWTQSAVNREAFALGTGDEYYVSGNPMPSSFNSGAAIPIFRSANGVDAWMQANGDAGLAQTGPAISGVTADAGARLLFLVWADKNDQNVTSGRTELIGGDGSAFGGSGAFSAVPAVAGSPTDLRSIVLVGGKTMLGTAESGSLYLSSDRGVDWQRIEFDTTAPHPSGTKLFDLGNGKYLLLGNGGVWVATPS